MALNLILVRAGQTDVLPGTLIGQSDPPLGAAGFIAVQRLAATWDEETPRFLFASDLRRAAQTAQVLASHLALEPLPDPRLREQDAGRWNGRPLQAIARDDPDLHAAWRQRRVLQAAPGGESFADVLQRTGAWLSALLDSTHAHDSVLVVTHQGVVRALLCHALALPPQHAERLRIDHAGVTLISHERGGFEVSFVNANRFQDTCRHE